ARARRNLKDSQIIVFEQGDLVSFGACGLPYYAGAWFDDPAFMLARSPDQLRESGIDVRLRHKVTAMNHAARTVTVINLDKGEVHEESFDRLLLATGANPIRPPFPGLDLANIQTLTKMADGEKLRSALADPACKEVAVIGAGFIGIETVEACLHRGKSVRLIQLDDRVLVDAFDKEITDLLERHLIDAGVSLHLSETVKGFKGDNGKLAEVLTDKGSYAADLAILAVGVRPATAFLAGSGLETMPNGAIIVDREGGTNLPDVYAAGDCASVPLALDGSPAYVPLATGANKLGRVVGDVLAGKAARYPGSLSSACIKVLGMEAGRTGISERDAVRGGIPCKTVFIQDKDHANYWPGQSDIAVKLLYDPESRKLIGGQVAGGQGAVLRTDVLAAAITGGLTVEQLGMLDLCYAPPFARTWDVLNVAGNVAK
ncbi:MAG TPA: CoA-disulfide reductase, partial [Desulfurivibrionaceae bacterium]|nr:CoA-disulfide reductase [Desulfurivibrionaceae bacterium]